MTTGMKILFLSHYFPPEVNAPATRTYEHCKRWVENGHEVTVLSCVPHHPMGKVFPGYRNRVLQREVKDGINAVKVLTYVTPNEGFLKRTFNYVFYMLMAIAVAPRLGRFDVVISTSPQFFNGLAGLFVSRMKRCPWVLEIRDLWPASIAAVGAMKNERLIGALEAIETFAYRKADHIVPLTQPFADHIIATTGRTESTTVIPNGADLDLFVLPTRVRDNPPATFVAAYVGTHGLAHQLDTLVEAARILQHRTDIRLLTAGDGAERARIEARIRAMGLTNLSMLGQLPKTEVVKLLESVDATLVLLKDHELFTTVIPSKMFESMAMATPMVLAGRGECRRILEESQSGICVTPGSANELADAIVRLADHPEIRREYAASGRRYVETNYNRQIFADKYMEVLNRIVSQKRLTDSQPLNPSERNHDSC